jgi:LysR family transcriptional regulator, transcriptional activator of nhaA
MIDGMEWLNYHHLLYFWMVAREGGLTQAGKVLRLSHPTLSAQVHALEDRLGEKLFAKVGRRLVLTDMGRIVFRYADEIFSLGREMLDAVKDRPTGKALRLQVGVVNVVPKLIVRRLLEPALHLAEPVRIVCHEGTYEALLPELALHELDLILADVPVPPGSTIRAFSRLLGQCGVALFGTEALARKYRRRFPQSLDGAPMLLPLENLPLRRALNQWFDANGVRPRVVGEFEDSALLKAFGADGVGLFPAALAIEKQVVAQHGVQVVGRAGDVKEHFYAISVERRLKHPAVKAISEAARSEIFRESERP